MTELMEIRSGCEWHQNVAKPLLESDRTPMIPISPASKHKY